MSQYKSPAELTCYVEGNTDALTKPLQKSLAQEYFIISYGLFIIYFG